MAENILSLIKSNSMTEAEYDIARAAIAGTSKSEVGTRWEQDLARLFDRSGWTQRQLAEREGMGKSRVDQLIRFGSFLSCPQLVGNPDPPLAKLTEGKFRGYWKDSEGEEDRFMAVTEYVQEPDMGAALGKALQKDKLLLDGAWRSETKITRRLLESVSASERQATKFMNGLRGKNRPLKTERKKVGTGFHYRFFTMEKTIPVTEIVEKLGPLWEQLETERRKPLESVSTPTLGLIARRIEKLLEEWTK